MENIEICKNKTVPKTANCISVCSTPMLSKQDYSFNWLYWYIWLSLEPAASRACKRKQRLWKTQSKSPLFATTEGIPTNSLPFQPLWGKHVSQEARSQKRAPARGDALLRSCTVSFLEAQNVRYYIIWRKIYIQKQPLFILMTLINVNAFKCSLQWK